jgi:hypothetical protein
LQINNLMGERIYLPEFMSSNWLDVHAYASQEIVCLFQPWGPNTADTLKYAMVIFCEPRKALCDGIYVQRAFSRLYG